MRRAKMNEERSSYMPHWQELSRYNEPRLGRFVTGRSPNKGSKKNQYIIDSTAKRALRVSSAGMLYGMTSPARPWFRLTLEDQDLAKYEPVKHWLQIVQQRILDMFRKSNLYAVLPRIYKEELLFGTSAMMMSDDYETLFRFYPYTIGSYWMAQDEREVVNTLYRQANMTAINAAKRFGKENLSKAAQRLVEKSPDTYIPLYHCVEPNDDRKGKFGNQAMNTRTVWYEEGADADKLLLESGHPEFPIMAPRWELNDEDVYGSSCPGMDTLGDSKQLQHQHKQKGKNIDKITDPPMQAPSNLKGKRVSQIPGEVTYYDTAQGGVRFEPSVIVPPDAIRHLREDIAEVQKRIRDGFFEDLFFAITNMEGVQPRNVMELAERKEEKLLGLGPVVENNVSDLLDPMINRAFAMGMRQSEPIWKGLVHGIPVFPPPPEELVDQDIKIEQISILAQAQKAIGTQAMEQTLGFAGSLAELGGMDKIDVFKAIDIYAEAKGAPADLVVSDDEAKAKADARAQAQAQAQSMMAMTQMADAAAKAGSIPVDEDHAAGAMMEAARR